MNGIVHLSAKRMATMVVTLTLMLAAAGMAGRGAAASTPYGPGDSS